MGSRGCLVHVHVYGNVVNREVLGEACARTPGQVRRAHVYARIVARRQAGMLMSGIKKSF